MWLQSIPVSFRKYLRNNTVAILSKGDKKWAVTIGDDWVFGDGWDGFMKDNGEQDFDFVVFKHHGNMVFDTMVFDTSLCEREYSNNQVTKSFKKQKLDNNVLKNISKGKDTNVNRSTKSQAKAERPMAPDQNHHPKCFIGILIKYQTSLKLCIPKDFGLANGLGNGEMILKNAENKGSWSVELKHKRDRKFYIQRGFPEFCTSIGLENGDSFRFELIHNGEKPVAVVSSMNFVSFS
ncbi:B3 domain-containing protein REM10-like [Bidens hawaiensis]|uniref:B3 domain-containing protein REM10-like n=1 Tax=Bidens hawaiensis TaxID=980011 RepID=UPI0040490473